MDKITVVCHKDHDKGYEDFQGKCLLCVVDELMREVGRLTAVCKEKEDEEKFSKDWQKTVAKAKAKLKEKNG